MPQTADFRATVEAVKQLYAKRFASEEEEEP